MSGRQSIDEQIKSLDDWKRYANRAKKNSEEIDKTNAIKNLKIIFGNMNGYRDTADIQKIFKYIWGDDAANDMTAINNALNAKYTDLWNCDNQNSICANFIVSIDSGKRIAPLDNLLSAIKIKKVMQQPAGQPPTKARLAPIKSNASGAGAAAGGAEINDKIKTALGDKYNPDSHSILNPGFKPLPEGNPNEVVDVANNYISVAQNISQISDYKTIQGVKHAVNAIRSAVTDFNTKKSRSTKDAIVIQSLSGGGKRKRNTKIGTKKKQYKSK